MSDEPKRSLIPKERIDLVEGLYLAGKSRLYITRRVCDEYHVTTRQARNYIALVEKRLAALPKPPPEAAFQRVEAMLLETYDLARNGVQRIAVSQGAGAGSVVEEFPQANVGAMATVTARLADLHGVGGPQKLDLTSGGKPIQSLTDDELAARVAQRLAALEALRKGSA